MPTFLQRILAVVAVSCLGLETLFASGLAQSAYLPKPPFPVPTHTRFEAEALTAWHQWMKHPLSGRRSDAAQSGIRNLRNQPQQESASNPQTSLSSLRLPMRITVHRPYFLPEFTVQVLLGERWSSRKFAMMQRKVYEWIPKQAMTESSYWPVDDQISKALLSFVDSLDTEQWNTIAQFSAASRDSATVEFFAVREDGAWIIKRHDRVLEEKIRFALLQMFQALHPSAAIDAGGASNAPQGAARRTRTAA